MTKALTEFVKRNGKLYSQRLGIDITKEPFKWFVASILFGARISEKIVFNTYKQFKDASVLSPEKILKAGWDKLVALLDAGGYVRYDFKTADKLLEVCRNLVKNYKGDLKLLYKCANDYEELCTRLKNLGKGIGDVTVNIFLRDMQSVWKKACSKPTALTRMSMQKIGISDLKRCAHKIGVNVENLETALIVLAKDYCRKKRCAQCTLTELCKSYRR
jgi:endonuclease III